MPKNDTPQPIYRYQGSGEFYNGIPARDLTQEDFDALDAQAQAVVKSGDLYGDIAAQDAERAARKAERDAEKQRAEEEAAKAAQAEAEKNKKPGK